MVRAVLFDLDGTLIDTLADLANASNAVLAKYGLPVHDRQRYRQFVGNGARNLMQRSSGTADSVILETLYADFIQEYDRTCLNEARAYDGVEDTLDRLLQNGYRLGVVTNKPHAQAVRLIKHLFGDRFGCVFGGCETYPRKPDPASVYLAADALGVSVEECLFVGDSDVDVLTAHTVGIPCVGCTFGFRGKEELERAGADYLIDSFQQLQKNQLLFE